MKTEMVERKVPENYKDCDQLITVSNCRECVNAQSYAACRVRKALYDRAVVEGKLRMISDGNGETFYQEVLF